MRTFLLIVLSFAVGLHGIGMNFSAQKARRNRPCGGLRCSAAAMVTVAAVVLLLCGQTQPVAAARHAVRGPWQAPWQGPWNGLFGESRPKSRRIARAASVPLPRPRPAEAPAIEADKSAEGKPAPTEAEGPAEQAAPAPTPQPSACRLALSDAIAIAPSIPDIHGAGGCGGEDLVRLEAVVLPDKHLVALKPAAILRCAMASAVANWVRTDIVPLAASLGSTVTDLDNFDSFECRGRNRVAGAPLSEHGRANALDVRSFKLANGRSISLTDRAVSRELRESVLHSVCARFSTVLGPGSDWYHEDHIHLDLMVRHNDYKICQWNVWDPMPPIAPLIPAERPDEAPRREAAKSDASKSDSPRSDSPKSEVANPNAVSDPAPRDVDATPATKTPPTKKRKHKDR
jgi:hypothetical protein